jgi:hypothetical protein
MAEKVIVNKVFFIMLSLVYACFLLLVTNSVTLRSYLVLSYQVFSPRKSAGGE